MVEQQNTGYSLADRVRGVLGMGGMASENKYDAGSGIQDIGTSTSTGGTSNLSRAADVTMGHPHMGDVTNVTTGGVISTMPMDSGTYKPEQFPPQPASPAPAYDESMQPIDPPKEPIAHKNFGTPSSHATPNQHVEDNSDKPSLGQRIAGKLGLGGMARGDRGEAVSNATGTTPIVAEPTK